MSYDDAYRACASYFGDQPNRILISHLDLLDKNKPILDIGAGQGRNSVFLARSGYMVEAVDPSAVAVEAIQTAARKDNLPITVSQTGFEEFNGESGAYGGILIFGLIQELAWEEIERLIQCVRLWCADGGLVFVTAHGIGDASMSRFSPDDKIGKNSYRDASGSTRTYLEPGEIIRLFEGFYVVEHWEGPGPVHRHGDGPPEQHPSIEAVFRLE
jgi:2-polyprenyl-3-methyl-5-hydroxy-6-metoxy-1,4-benzoquinol methylase